MFAIAGSLATTCSPMKKRRMPVIVTSSIFDVAGAITLIVLGALALTGHGGSVINSLNTVNGGAWAMIGGGLVTLTFLYLLARMVQYNKKLVMQKQALKSYIVD